MTLPRALPHLVALTLGVAAALLVACGGSTKGGIPAASAGELRSQIEDVGQAVDGGRCDELPGQLRQVDVGVDALPATVDERLRQSLRDAADQLRRTAISECGDVTTTETQTTETTQTQTVPPETTTTETTETQTVPPQTTTVPPPTTTPVPPPPVQPPPVVPPPVVPPPVVPPPVVPPPVVPSPAPAPPAAAGGGATPGDGNGNGNGDGTPP